MRGLDPHDWTGIFTIAGFVFAGLSVWAVRDITARRNSQSSEHLSVGKVASGILGMVVISLFAAIVIWGAADAWIFGGGIPSEYEPFSRGGR